MLSCLNKINAEYLRDSRESIHFERYYLLRIVVRSRAHRLRYQSAIVSKDMNVGFSSSVCRYLSSGFIVRHHVSVLSKSRRAPLLLAGSNNNGRNKGFVGFAVNPRHPALLSVSIASVSPLLYYFLFHDLLIAGFSESDVDSIISKHIISDISLDSI